MADPITPGTDYGTAVQNVASILSSYCGRPEHGASMRACPYDHTPDAQAVVRSVVQYAFPELLRQLRDQTDDSRLPAAVEDKIVELEARAMVVPPR
jgi:hypothetical protein